MYGGCAVVDLYFRAISSNCTFSDDLRRFKRLPLFRHQANQKKKEKRNLRQVLSSVHTEASSTATKAVALGSVLPTVTLPAVQLLLVLRAVGGVEEFAAHTWGGWRNSKGFRSIQYLDWVTSIFTDRTIIDFLINYLSHLFPSIYGLALVISLLINFQLLDWSPWDWYLLLA